MAWNTQWQLEGVFLFGGPLDIWEMALVHDHWGNDLPYQILHMRLDRDPNLFDRLMPAVRNNDLVLNQLTIIYRHGNSSYGTLTEYSYSVMIQQPRLYSLEKYYSPVYGTVWDAVTLGISFDRGPANNSAIKTLFGGHFDLQPDRY